MGERKPGFQVPYAERIRKDAGVATMAVGVITEARQAEAILQEGRADLVALGRELMWDPFWTLRAAGTLGADPEAAMWPQNYSWAIKRRAQIQAQNQAQA
ncbi:MAG: hypothetical protein R3D67_01635 [Hyphomicrobiaceae bacterium]